MIILMKTLKPLLNIIKKRFSQLLFKKPFVLPYERNFCSSKAAPLCGSLYHAVLHNTIEIATGIYYINNCGSNQNTQAIQNIRFSYKNKI